MRTKRALVWMVPAVILLLTMLAASGCGGDSPSATVEAFLKAAKDKDCEKMVDLVDLSGAHGITLSREEMVQACQAESGIGDVVSYKILEEKVEGEKATVNVEVTTREGGEEKTETDPLQLNKKDGEWLISTF